MSYVYLWTLCVQIYTCACAHVGACVFMSTCMQVSLHVWGWFICHVLIQAGAGRQSPILGSTRE